MSYLSKVGRQAAILTTLEVDGAEVLLDQFDGGNVSVQLSFTLGSLTNVVLRPYVSMDGSTWLQLSGESGALLAPTLTASATTALHFACAGWKYFKLSAQGTGTVTSSLLAFSYRGLHV